jgi:tetratricopeptide (TPR) repeat protein
MSSVPESASNLDEAETLAIVQEIRTFWNDKDYSAVASRCRALLERAPGDVYGLTYLARSAAYAQDWDDVAQAAAALADQSPIEAFVAATKLNRASHRLEAATIFASLDFGGDWFDDKVAELASREGYSLLSAGEAAAANGDDASAKVFFVAAARLAPRSQKAYVLRNRATRAIKQRAYAYDFNQDPAGYLKAWREVLWCNPADVLALARIARAGERLDVKGSIDTWLKILAIDPGNEVANGKVRILAKRNSLEDHAIRGLIELGRDENHDPVILDLVRDRDARAQIEHDKLVRAALQRARAADRDEDPRQFLSVWKEVLELDPANLAAARRVVLAARQLGDYSELVSGLSALLELEPTSTDMAQRLAAAALHSGEEQGALEQLARLGLADLSVRQIAGLHSRVFSACRNAINAADFDRALSCFQILELVDREHSSLEPLRAVVANKAAANAMGAEKQGNLAAAVALAERVLQIVPDQPIALTIVARDLWRHRRFGDIVELCKPRVKSGPEYARVKRLLDRAAAAA